MNLGFMNTLMTKNVFSLEPNSLIPLRLEVIAARYVPHLLQNADLRI
jgi:hypothetical protein